MNKNKLTRNVLIEKIPIIVKVKLGDYLLFEYYQVRNCKDIYELKNGLKMLGVSNKELKPDDFYVIMHGSYSEMLLFKTSCEIVKKIK